MLEKYVASILTSYIGAHAPIPPPYLFPISLQQRPVHIWPLDFATRTVQPSSQERKKAASNGFHYQDPTLIPDACFFGSC